jgi:hypothetical protein
MPNHPFYCLSSASNALELRCIEYSRHSHVGHRVRRSVSMLPKVIDQFRDSNRLRVYQYRVRTSRQPTGSTS